MLGMKRNKNGIGSAWKSRNLKKIRVISPQLLTSLRLPRVLIGRAAPPEVMIGPAGVHKRYIIEV